MRNAIVASLFLVGMLAGCVSSEDDPNPTGGPDGFEAFSEGTWPSGQAARDYIESYVMTHPFRLTGQGTDSFMDTARTDLIDILEGFGYPVHTQEYRATGTNIYAVKNGTQYPDQWVVLSAHYDTVGAGGLGPTVYGAWDDGAGVAVLLELAESWADWDFPFSIAFMFFDEEEKGLVGSQAFVADYIENNPHNIDVLANLNTDPPGMNWPCGDALGSFPVKIIHQMDQVASNEFPRYNWLYETVEYALNETGVPTEVVDYTAGIPVATLLGVGIRGGSDHVSFGNANLANVFIGGLPVTIINGDANENTAAAMTYLLHTPLDTLEQMEARCMVGTLSEGLQVTVDLFTHSMVYMAKNATPT